MKNIVQKILEECEDKAILLAVTKTRSIAEIQKLYDLGLRDFGENKVQELLTKVDLAADIRWHFIGNLQTNKVKDLLPHVSCIHSVNSLKLLAEIEKQAARIDRIIPILIEVNIAEEETKKGIMPYDVSILLKEAFSFSHILPKGIMVMGPHTDCEQEIRTDFRKAAALFTELKKEYPSLDTLSMGMSHDYVLALEEGSTLLRIGTLLFQ